MTHWTSSFASLEDFFNQVTQSSLGKWNILMFDNGILQDMKLIILVFYICLIMLKTLGLGSEFFLSFLHWDKKMIQPRY